MKRMGGSTINHTIKQAAYATATGDQDDEHPRRRIHHCSDGEWNEAAEEYHGKPNGVVDAPDRFDLRIELVRRQVFHASPSGRCRYACFIIPERRNVTRSRINTELQSDGASSNAMRYAGTGFSARPRNRRALGRPLSRKHASTAHRRAERFRDVSRETSVWVGRGFPVQYTQDSKLRAKRGSHAL